MIKSDPYPPSDSFHAFSREQMQQASLLEWRDKCALIYCHKEKQDNMVKSCRTNRKTSETPG